MKDRAKNIQLHMTLLVHASACRNKKCPSANCAKMKALLRHGKNAFFLHSSNTFFTSYVLQKTKKKTTILYIFIYYETYYIFSHHHHFNIIYIFIFSDHITSLSILFILTNNLFHFIFESSYPSSLHLHLFIFYPNRSAMQDASDRRVPDLQAHLGVASDPCSSVQSEQWLPSAQMPRSESTFEKNENGAEKKRR
jgi:hypothetical protein